MRYFHFPHIKGYTLCAAAVIGMLPAMNSYSASSTGFILTPAAMTLNQGGSAPALNHPSVPMNRTPLVPNNAQGDQLLMIPEPTQPISKDGAATTSTSKKPHYKDGEVLVLFRKGIATATANSALSAKAATVVKRFDQLTARTGQVFALVRGGKGVSSAQLMKTLSKDSRVQAASLNYGKRPTVVASDPLLPNDTFFQYQWSLNNTGQEGGALGADIKAPTAWTQHTDSKDVVIAVVDTGVDYEHSDLKNSMWVNPGEIADDGVDNDKNGYIDDIHGIDTGFGDSDPAAVFAHGTHVAGIIAAEGNNGKGVTGINWRGRIMAIQGFSSDGYMYDDAELAALQYILTMKNKGTNIVAVNASYGCYECENEVMAAAIEKLGDVDIAFVAAAGNEENDNDAYPSYPASYELPNVISVAATDPSDQLAWYSNYGATSVDLGAPGSSILSTYWLTTYIPQAGDVFFDDVELGTNGWFADAPWAITATTATNHVWTDSPAGDYSDDQFSVLVSPPINLAGQKIGSLSVGFKAKYELEYGYDFLDVFLINPVVWKVTTEQKRSGSKAWSDSPNGNYVNNANGGIISPTIDLSTAPFGSAMLNFYLKGRVETDYDKLWILCGNETQGFEDLGYIDFELGDWTPFQVPLPDTCLLDDAKIIFELTTDVGTTFDGYYLDDISVTVNGTTVFMDDMEGVNHWQTFGEQYSYQGYITGSSGGLWNNYSFPLFDKSLYTNDARIMFVFRADISVVDDGVYLDDIGVGQMTVEHDFYAWMSGTSMATPHVTGAVGFLASVFDEPMAARIERIVTTTDSIAPVDEGDSRTTASGRLNLAAAINSIPVNSALCVGNFDNDGDVDDADKTVFGAAFGSRIGQARYNVRADFDKDDDVDGSDLVTFRANYGRTNCPVSD